MEYDEAYPGIFLSSLNEMRKAEVMCDFTIKVDGNSFHVHSVVLAAASKYFTSLFSSKMKEVKQAFVDMKSLDVVGVRQCIQYMYTGGIEPKMESVQYTLEASTLIQLNGLTSICFKFLKNNLSVDTCLSTLKLSSLHGRDDVSKLSENYVLENFEAVTSTEMFPLISKPALLHYIEASKAKHDVTWQAVMRWLSVVKEESVLFDVMKSINLPEFPFQFLLETVLNDPLLNDNCRKLVIDSLFADVDMMKNNLSTENFFVVKNLSITNLESKIKEAVGDYLAENFEELMKKDEFNNLEKYEIVSLFQSPNIKYSLEETKWFAALKWTKYDQRHREKFFPKLFQTIKLELLPPDFIHQTVRNETLVKKSHECKDLIMDALYAHGGGKSKQEEQTLIPHIACMDICNRNIKALNLTTNQWKNLPSVNLSKKPFSKQTRIFNVRNGIFCLDFERVLKFDKNEMKWIQKQSCSKQPSEHMEVAVVQKHIYVVDRDVMACYDVVCDSWEENLPGCGLGEYFCAASSNRFIYTMGGYKYGKFIADAKQFDSVTQSYSQITDMNTARWAASAAVFHEKVFVVGGTDGNKDLESVEIYQPLAKTWTELIRSTCARCRFSSTCVSNNTLYIVGGDVDEKGNILKTRFIKTFDESTKEFKVVKEYDSINWFTPCCAVNLRCDNNK